MKMRFKWIAALILASWFISGCWDATDIDRRSIIVALGLDPAPNHKVLVTAQLPISGSNSLTSSLNTSDKSFLTITSIGKTAYGATLGMESKTSNKLFYMLLKTVVINASLAEQGLKPYCEFLERHSEINPQSMMVLTETTAREMLSIPLNTKNVPGLTIYNFFQSPSQAGQVFPVKTYDLVKKIEIKPIDAYLPIVSYNTDEQVYKLDQIGVFHRDRLVGKLSETESRMAGMIMRESHNATFTVPVGKMGEISYRKIIWTRKISITKTEPKLEFLITIKAKGFAPEITQDPTELKPGQIKEIERATANYLKRNIMTTLRHLQQVNSDIIGFGDVVRADKPEVWKQLNWDQDYNQAGFRVKVKFTLERVGKYR